jgi:hypothetical protein
MKSTDEHVMIYDDECGVCSLSARGLMKTGLLDKNSSVSFSEASERLKRQLDVPKACNEIALINLRTGATIYGISSLLLIVGNRFPFLKPFFRIPAIQFFLKKIYSFISFNRKVIIPGEKFEEGHVCKPAFNLKYRAAYIVATWFVTAFILNIYAALLFPVLPAGNFYREFVICGGQIVFQSIMLAFIKKERIIHYLGNMMTISMGGAILLLAITPLKFFIHSLILFSGWFAVVVSLMFLEHIRRSKILGLPWIVSATWVLYRLIVLAMIFALT